VNDADDPDAGGANPRRLHVYNGGFFTRPRIHRILTLAGYEIALGAPGPGGLVGVWGASPTSGRGEAVAEVTGAEVIRVEDAFLRSVRPGRDGDPPLGLLIDPKGVHFDPSRPSVIEHLLATDPLDDFSLLERSRSAIDRLRLSDLSKYNIHDPALPVPDPGYVLVIDQTEGDASVTASGANAATFAEMLAFAEIENPGAPILIKSHPETVQGHRPGHFGAAQVKGRIAFLTDPVSPHRLLEGAVAVYTVSSQLGFEAILAGHRPRVFGQPFYAGWGLTQDENPVPRRERKVTRAQLFAAAMILAPTWYDPCRDRLCTLEEAIDQLEADVRVWREDRNGHVAVGMRRWKRPHLRAFFGRHHRLAFSSRPPANPAGRGVLAWGASDLPDTSGLRRVEDGFLRSRGLGAALTPPLSLVADDLGIYYDPTHPSRLEALVTQAAALPERQLHRAERLIRALSRSGATKYNLAAGPLPDLPAGRKILVVGQVEDDASVLLGCSDVATNRALLEAARADFPGAILVYKPHPDVEAGLRSGALPEADLARLSDVVARNADPAALILACDEVATMTSLLGFEALLRSRPVTCYGVPFYAGWGLTRDRMATPARRAARPSLAALAHAALIAYPRYLDPVSGLPCPPEVIVERLATGATLPARRGFLARLQALRGRLSR
jgi:capsular polysaccharide export protein